MEWSILQITLIILTVLVSLISISLWTKNKRNLLAIKSYIETIEGNNQTILENQKATDQLNEKYVQIVNIDQYVDEQRRLIGDEVTTKRIEVDAYVTETKQKLYEERNAKREQVNLYVSESRANVEKEILEKREEANQYYDLKLKESEALTQTLVALNEKYINALGIFNSLEKEINIYQEDLDIKSFGLYKPVYDYSTSEEYKSKLEYNYLRQKQSMQADVAAHCAKEWTVDGSKVEGRKFIKLQKKLMLFAFNGECNSMIARMKWNTATRTIEKIEKAYDSINKLGQANHISITYEFLQLKKEELALTHEYLNKIQEEKEEQRMIREQMREEEKAKREYDIAQREAAEEERNYQKALKRIQGELQFASKEDVDTLNGQIELLEQKLKEASEKKERAISMAQLTKVGHIYIISNIGSFGEDVYKIGMTRRLDPQDRVRELGGASVPFHFDVHAIVYSEDAPQMEYDLHKQFKDKRINRVNGRKEFFKVSLDEIEEFVNQHGDASIKMTKSAEAKEYRETMAMINSLLEESAIEDIEVESKFPESLI